jgi:hypothetical protein
MEARRISAMTFVVVAAFFAGSLAFGPNDSLTWYADLKNPLVLVGIATLIFIAWQAFETRRAAKATQISAESALKTANITETSVTGIINKERARISIERKYGDGLFEGYAERFAETGISITQDGPTNAYSIRGEFKIVINESSSPPPMEAMWTMDIPTTIKPTVEPIIAHAFIPTDVTQEFINNLDGGKVFMHFFGFISYQDVFGTDRKTTFRYMWTCDEMEDVADGHVEWDCGWQTHGTRPDNQAT